MLSLYKVSVSSRVADVEDFRTDMKRFVENIARHCTVEKLLEKAFMIPMATRKELNLLFNANKDSLMQKGVSIHQKRWVRAECGVCMLELGVPFESTDMHLGLD